MIRLDLTHLHLSDECFDMVLCVHVLMHIPHGRAAMREMFRVLRPGGVALVMIPLDSRRETTYEDPWVIHPKDRTRLFGEFDFVRVYGRDFIDRIQGVGFDVTVVDPAKEYDESMRRTYGIWNEPIYICRRPHRSIPVAEMRAEAIGAKER